MKKMLLLAAKLLICGTVLGQQAKNVSINIQAGKPSGAFRAYLLLSRWRVMG
jgi:hypothetical protein